MSSLVETDPFAFDEPAHGLRAAQPAHGREVNLLGLAWRSRWLLLLMILVGGGAAWTLLQRVTPRYTSVSRIYVERNLPRLLDAELQVGQSATYLYTQAELIRSSPVLAAAVDAAGNASLETFRDSDNPVGFLHEELSVSVGTQDDIINVALELPNSSDAAQLVNSVVDAYITKYAEQRRNSAAEVLTILRSEKERRDAELEERRQALDDFREQHQELAVQVHDGNVVSQRFSSLSQELNTTEIDLLQAKAIYNRAKKMYDTPQQRPFLLEMAGSEQQALRDIELERQVQELEQTLTAERSRWGEGHPRVKLLRESLAEQSKKLTKKQAAVIEAYVESVRQAYELLDQKRTELQAAYDRTFESATEVSAQLTQLESLKESYERTEKLCDILDERIKEVNLSEEAAGMDNIVSILEVAAPSVEPSYPSRARFLGGGLLLGGLVGFGLAWLRELMDQRLKSVDEISDLLQLSVVGVVPYTEAAGARSHAGQLVSQAPRSAIAEAIRTLRTALHFGLAGHEVKVIAVTSPLPGDGKSTIASNLAIAMAQADQRVLLIDADLRKPTQHIIFDASAEKGLASVLGARLPVSEAIVPSGVASLDLLPCGPLPANPVELLNNGFFSELLETLKGRYDKILIDSPPVMPVADARVIAAISDATLLVLRAERSTRRMSLGARNELWRVRATRLGVVLNGVPQRKHGAYAYGDADGYGYGYGAYAAIEEPASGRRPKKSRALIQATATAAAPEAPAETF
ncbi:MAG: polysaccharide biosynthesis tyrosine autokinase [Pirellulales bacterium]|nr:polysaccharide biosynthesis tyrosine autokinase [Pirellulales bacterium]